MEKKLPLFAPKKTRWPPDLQNSIFKIFENMFFMAFKVADSDYGIDYCLFLKTKKFQKLPSPPLKQSKTKLENSNTVVESMVY